MKLTTEKVLASYRAFPPIARPFEPRGAAVSLLYDKSDEVLLCGPAGTGKSRACLEKVHMAAQLFPNSRHLMVRKTRESLTQSTLVTYQNLVIAPSDGVTWRSQEQEYRYLNGSTVVVGGMDKASKIMSTEYDMIYIPEATELTPEDYESLITRARYGSMPFNQVIADCNPGPPTHWLKRRADLGKVKMYNSRHQDNPTLFDNGQWTDKGVAYMRKLDSLTGVRRLRLRDGLWAAAEGMVYDNYDPAIHFIDRFDVPKSWPRVWSIDFGFVNPFVWQCWALDEDNRAFLMAELYHTGLLVEEATHMISNWVAEHHEEDPVAVICDHDAEGRATFEKHAGLLTRPATKTVLEGIEAVKTRLTVQHDGKARLYYMRDTLIHPRDTALVDNVLPTCTVEELEGYQWEDHNKKDRDQPKKLNDHGCDAMRYAAMYLEREMGRTGIFV